MDAVERSSVNTVLGYLTFGVRYFSRILSKGKGQVAVWSKCKEPDWWRKEVGLPWKNPTENPKDTKEILIRKYTALRKYLKENEMFPADVEDEDSLWQNREYEKLLLLGSLKRLHWRTKSLSKEVQDVLGNVKCVELLHQTSDVLMNDIQESLRSIVQYIEDARNNCSGESNKKQPLRAMKFKIKLGNDDTKCQKLKTVSHQLECLETKRPGTTAPSESQLERLETKLPDVAVSRESRPNDQTYFGKYQKNDEILQTVEVRKMYVQTASSSVQRKRKCQTLCDDNVAVKKKVLEAHLSPVRPNYATPVTIATNNLRNTKDKQVSTSLTLTSDRLAKHANDQSEQHVHWNIFGVSTSSSQLPVTTINSFDINKHRNSVTVTSESAREIPHSFNKCHIPATVTTDFTDTVQVTHCPSGYNVPYSETSFSLPKASECSSVVEIPQISPTANESALHSICDDPEQLESIINTNFNYAECLKLFNSPSSFIGQDFLNSCK